MNRDFYSIKEKDFFAEKGCKMHYVFYDDNQPKLVKGQLTETFHPITDLEFIKNNPSLLWIDFCNIDTMSGRGAYHSYNKIQKRVYFGELKKFGEVKSCQQYPSYDSRWEDCEDDTLVVLTRDGKTIIAITEEKNKNGNVKPAQWCEVLNESCLARIKEITPKHKSISYLEYCKKPIKIEKQNPIIDNFIDDEYQSELK